MPRPEQIPRIIHQTWKDEAVPSHWRPFQESWRRHHPDWRYRLWTDHDNRELIRRSYPWFLAIYDGYREPIRRVDAARYFLLHRHGGVYADLDFEALKPIDPLIAGFGLVLGHEPAPHLAELKPQWRGLRVVLGNALIATRRGHPFWDFLFERLAAARDEEDTLDATGPFLLTRAVADYPEWSDLSLAPSELLYPVDKYSARDGLLASPESRRRLAQTAYADHHWAGSWWLET